MKLKPLFFHFCAMAAVGALTMVSAAHAEPGLLLAAHGAPMKNWNEPVLQFGEQVAKRIAETGKYKAVRTGMLEFAEPSLAKMVRELEAEGCDRIVVVPLFVAPSAHTTYDLPAILGLYTAEEMRKTLAKEKAEIAHPHIPILITETLNGGELLSQYALAECKKISTDPAKESLVILLHGDETHDVLVESIARKVTTFCCGKMGIDDADWVYVEMGQSFALHGASAISNALERKDRVLVVGLYLSSSAKSVATTGMAMASSAKMMGIALENPLESDRVAFSESGIIAFPGALDWVIDTALRAIE